MSVHEKCELLHDIISKALSVIPFTYVRFSNKDKPWITPVVKSLINRRYQAFRSRNYVLYHHYKMKVKKAIEKAKENWTTANITSFNGVWKIANNVANKNKSNTLTKLIQTFDSPTIAANAINTKIQESFTTSPNWPEVLSSIPDCSNDWSPDVNACEVLKMLLSLKENKSSGSDQLPPRLLKAAAYELAQPLTHVIALSFESRAVPNKWKTAKVIPIPKKKRPLINDLRPISILPIFSKILEKFAVDSVSDSLIAMYGTNQYGFRPHSSTTCAHLNIHDTITRTLEDQYVKGVIVISFDLKKAFDSLKHAHLIKSLIRGQLPSMFLEWLVSYLQGRYQFVCLNNYFLSDMIPVTSGVPQGSVIAPFLFAAHMGSLKPFDSRTIMTKYADDIVSIIPVNDLTEVERLISNEINHVNGWCIQHGLN